MFSRRAFAQSLAGAALAPSIAAAATPGADDPIGNMIVIDALGGPYDPNGSNLDDGPPISPRVIRDMRASGMTAVNATFGYVMGDADPFEESVREVAMWDRIIREHSASLMKVLTTADIRRAKADQKVGIIYGFQNAAMMGKKAERVDLFADMGVRVIQLTYNNQNQLGGGSVMPGTLPLTPFGRKVIERLNTRNIIVDLSHSGERTCVDAIKASKKPVAITHTGCRALANLPRNKTDEELRLVGERGGFVGIYFMPFLSETRQITGDDVCLHIEHAMKVCGEDSVGIGTDGGTTKIDDMPKWTKAFARQIEKRRSLGISAPGERPDSYTFAIDMNGPDQFRILARKLAARGHSPRVIEKVLGGNFMRYAQSIWGA